ncbi:unnamed protein product [Lepeophtheirus salmonis]|uniref:(salmon louse) hypothetical protein n=1 Tax=Lepeophtheirus salmonis TaxID=72036 RepID=A0A7R8CIH7_LEPSM|nr:unnamed protein product [Lepeophtheirus salmonis]CAF2832445.1 unnamed protein product [Lepeophtheirus salmonis]
MTPTDASRLNGLTDYAMLEIELLAAVWILCKCHSYIFGLPEFMLITDTPASRHDHQQKYTFRYGQHKNSEAQEFVDQ